MVREAIESSIPMRLPAKERPRPTIGPLAGFIDEILEDDRRAPRKQRHTAHRIWVRITRERSSHPIAESTVRQYVRARKRTLGLRVVPEAFVPQPYAWGDEAQVDWYEADVDLDGERVTLQVFATDPRAGVRGAGGANQSRAAGTDHGQSRSCWISDPWLARASGRAGL